MSRRIAMISEHASPLAMIGGVDSGGQNVYVGQLAKHLVCLGYEVDVLTRRDSADLPEVVAWEEGVRVIHIKAGPASPVRKEDLYAHMPEFIANATVWMKHDAATMNKGSRESNRARYDLVHAHFWMSGMVAMALKRTLGIPFVITFHALGRVRRLHQGSADGFPEARLEIETRIVAEASRIIAECPQDEEDLIRLYGANPSKLAMIPCGFDPAEFEPMSCVNARRILNLAQDEFVVLQLGRMVPRKGIDNVVRAVAQLRHKHHVPARLLVVGGESDTPDPEQTPEIGRLMALADREGIADCITFTGRKRRDELKYFYNASDVFVTTPWYEPYGMTPLEAMACGTPVIGANVGGIKYTVRDGETGYLVPPNDADALAERLAHLWQFPEHRELLSQRALDRVQHAFTWKSIAARMSAVYEHMLSGTQPDANRRVSRTEAAIIRAELGDAAQTVERARLGLTEVVAQAADEIRLCFQRGNKVLVCGNGGSAADAQHFAAEFVGRFQPVIRRALPMLALSADTAFLTAWANDVSFDDVFARQVQAFGQPGDILFGISTSGRSRNVIAAFDAARNCEMRCIALTGGDGGVLGSLADVAIVSPSDITARIQEVHLLVIHLICQAIEAQLMQQHERSQVEIASNGKRVAAQDEVRK